LQIGLRKVRLLYELRRLLLTRSSQLPPLTDVRGSAEAFADFASAYADDADVGEILGGIGNAG
jgi:hypothetical protein